MGYWRLAGPQGFRDRRLALLTLTVGQQREAGGRAQPPPASRQLSKHRSGEWTQQPWKRGWERRGVGQGDAGKDLSGKRVGGGAGKRANPAESHEGALTSSWKNVIQSDLGGRALMQKFHP